jgi:hypothetical protein
MIQNTLSPKGMRDAMLHQSNAKQIEPPQKAKCATNMHHRTTQNANENKEKLWYKQDA